MHPVMFRIFGFPIHSYGVMLAIAFLFGIWLLSRQVREFGDDPDDVQNLALWILIPSILGARLFHCAVFWQHYIHEPWMIFNVREGGLVFYGGLIGGALGAIIYFKRKKKNVAAYADFIAPLLASGLAIARIGCTLAGCCYGKACPADFPLAMVYPPETVGVSGIPLYPTQPAESFMSFLIFLILYFYIRPRKKFHGAVIAWFLILYGVVRSTLEFFRNDPRGFVGLFTVHAPAGMTPDNASWFWKILLYSEAAVEKGAGLYQLRISESQTVSLILFAIAAALFITLPKRTAVDKVDKTPPPPRPEASGNKGKAKKKKRKGH